MKRIENFSAFAKKLKAGHLEYGLWTDEDGALYVQILQNLTHAGEPGTHSKLLFRVSDYLSSRHAADAIKNLRGLNPEKEFAPEFCRNNDDAGFLKAVIRHLLP